MVGPDEQGHEAPDGELPSQVWTLNRARTRRAARSLWMSWPQRGHGHPAALVAPSGSSQILPRSW
ncbi:MAG: hypothetical protein MZV64_22655 [Ignavibacteriales bacterium]|nr:hypothetical protein [Ignavibacteriales bacterium]